MKTPSSFMQGFISLLLMGNFTLVLLGPSLFPGWHPPEAAYQQTLVNLVILAVGYYLGSSQGSARKDELNAAQQDKTISALTPNGLGSDPNVPQKVVVDNSQSDPVPTTNVPNVPSK